MSAMQKKGLSVTCLLAAVTSLIIVLLDLRNVVGQDEVEGIVPYTRVDVLDAFARMQSSDNVGDASAVIASYFAGLEIIDAEDMSLLNEFATIFVNRLGDSERATLERHLYDSGRGSSVVCWMRATCLFELHLPELCLNELDHALATAPPEPLLDPILHARVMAALQMVSPDPQLVSDLLEDMVEQSSEGALKRALYLCATRGPGPGLDYCQPQRCLLLGNRHYHPQFLEEVLTYASEQLRILAAQDSVIGIMRTLSDKLSPCENPNNAKQVLEELLDQVESFCLDSTDPVPQETGLRLFHDLCVVSHNPYGSPLVTVSAITELASRLNASPMSKAILQEIESTLLLQQGLFDDAAARRLEAADLLRSIAPTLWLDAGYVEAQAIEDDAYSFLCNWYGQHLPEAITLWEDYAAAYPTGPVAAQVRRTARNFLDRVAEYCADGKLDATFLARAQDLAAVPVDIPWLGDSRFEATANEYCSSSHVHCFGSSGTSSLAAAMMQDVVPPPRPASDFRTLT